MAVLTQDTSKVLAISRIMVAWQPVGLAVGVYDMVARYVKERKQFGAPIAAFQVTCPFKLVHRKADFFACQVHIYPARCEIDERFFAGCRGTMTVCKQRC